MRYKNEMPVLCTCVFNIIVIWKTEVHWNGRGEIRGSTKKYVSALKEPGVESHSSKQSLPFLSVQAD